MKAKLNKNVVQQCRFCLEDDKKINLITPCKCKGTAKYIHNTCLLEWYKHQPDKALTCGTCKFKLKTKRLHEDEHIFPEINKVVPSFFSIYFLNSLFFVLYSAKLSDEKYFIVKTIYIGYQGFIHTNTLINIKQCISKVQSKDRYWCTWKQDKRWLLGVLVLILLCQYQTFICMGFSLQLLEFMWFVEHFEVLSLMNQTGGFKFVNK